MRKLWRPLGTLILVGVLIWRIDWRQVASAFAHLQGTYWLVALGLYLLTQGVSAARWQMLGRSLGLGGRWRDYLAHYFVGMFFNLVLPTSVGGDVVRAWYLGGQEGTSPPIGRRAAAFLSVLADRVNGFAVLIVVACLATLCCPTPLEPWITATVAGLGAACLLGLAALPVLPWLRRRLPAHPRLLHLLDGAELCWRDRRGLVWVTLLSLVVQLANVVLAWLIGAGLGLQVPPLYYGVLVPVVSILTLLPISLNGMGLREGGTVLLLAPLHVSEASAVTLSLLIFAVYVAASLFGGVVYLFGHRSPLSAVRHPPTTQADRGWWTAESGKEVFAHADPFGGDPHQGRRREPPAAA